MNAWDKIKKASSGLFITLKVGQEIEGIFIDSPYCFYSISSDQRRIEYQEEVQGSKLRVKIPFMTLEHGVYVAKIYAGNTKEAGKLEEMHEEHGFNCIYTLRGEAYNAYGSQQVSKQIYYKGQATAEQIEQISSIPAPRLQKDTNMSIPAINVSAQDERNQPPAY